MINLDRCYFHSVTPLFSTDLRSSNHLSQSELSQVLEEETKRRLKLILKTNHLLPGDKLASILPEYAKNFLNTSQSKYVYLAIRPTSKLENTGDAQFNAEFSAYQEHIKGSLALVFDEHTLTDLSIAKVTHWLSEEICIDGSVPLTNLIALALPLETPRELVKEYLFFIRKYANSSFFEEFIPDQNQKIKHILDHYEEYITQAKTNILEYNRILEDYSKNIPCINYSGEEYNIDSEHTWFKENVKELKQIIKGE